jgi:hypothetical protein
LYRQQVREKLRRVKLQDGSSITITRRHKLQKSDGWKRDLEVGDYVFGGNVLREFRVRILSRQLKANSW